MKNFFQVKKRKCWMGLAAIVCMAWACSCESVEPPQACADVVPNEACAAAFSRWFYNANRNECESIAYSGCEAYGFETLQECEACGCHP